MSDGPRAVFLGTGGAFSRAPLLALLHGGVEVCAVVVPAPRGALTGSAAARTLPGPRSVPGALPLFPTRREENIVGIAGEAGVPVLEVTSLGSPEALEQLAGYSPDVLCVACFPWRLPRALLALPPLGCLNVHPSLLPENRGPAPLFWTFREGADSTGVSVHLMTGELDAGDIVEQGVVAAPEGISGEEMDRRCSELGGALLVRSVRGLAAGTAIKRPQAPHRASYNGWPVAADFEVPVSWTARRAFRFIRGVSDWGTPPVILVNDERFRVRAALSYAEGQFLPVPYVRDGSELRVQFTPGVLRAETL